MIFHCPYPVGGSTFRISRLGNVDCSVLLQVGCAPSHRGNHQQRHSHWASDRSGNHSFAHHGLTGRSSSVEFCFPILLPEHLRALQRGRTRVRGLSDGQGGLNPWRQSSEGALGGRSHSTLDLFTIEPFHVSRPRNRYKRQLRTPHPISRRKRHGCSVFPTT